MIGAYLNDDIILRTTIRDKWNAVTERKLSIRGRIEFKTRMVTNVQGQQVISSASVIIETRPIAHKDGVTYAGKEYQILAIGEAKNFSRQFLRLDLA